MNNEKEIWIETMLAAASKPASSQNTNTALFKVFQVIDNSTGKNNTLTFNQFRAISVAAMIILALNIGVMTFSAMNPHSKTDAASGYGLNSYNLDLY